MTSIPYDKPRNLPNNTVDSWKTLWFRSNTDGLIGDDKAWTDGNLVGKLETYMVSTVD